MKLSSPLLAAIAATLCFGTVTPSGATTYYAWKLVTDDTSLAVDDTIIIAANGYDYALGEQKTNNRDAVSITRNGSIINDSDLPSTVQQLTLAVDAETGFFVFKTDSGYLYAASSSANNLKTKSSLDANGKWTVSIVNGVATIIAQGNNTRNWLRFNNGSNKLFTCYESGQQDVSLYRREVLPALSSPVELASSDVTSSGFTLLWPAVSGATGYDVACSGGFVSVNGTSATISGLSPSTTYNVSVVALGNGTTSSDSPAATLQVTTAAAAVNAPPVVRIFTSDLTPTDNAIVNAIVGESASVSVTADKGDLTVEINDNPGSTSLVEDYENHGTYIFSWTPPTLGEYTFIISSSFTPEGASESLTGSATLTVNANALSTPEHISASASGQTVSASWDTVQGAGWYEATLYGETTYVANFNDVAISTENTFSSQPLSGMLSGGSEQVTWTSVTNGARVCTQDAWFASDNPALTIRANKTYPVTFGPFPNDILSIAFKYRKAYADTSSGHIRVFLINDDETETEIANSYERNSSGVVALNNMEKPESETTTYLFSTNLINAPVQARSFKISGTFATVIDDVEVHILAQTDTQDVNDPTHACTFSGLNPATYYAVGVKAAGSTPSNESVASPEVVSELVRTAGNTQPTLSVSGATVPAGTAAVLTLNGHDDDDDELTYTVSPTGLGTIAIDDQTGAATFAYTPNAIGSTTFTFTVSDGNGGSATAEATVTATLGTPVVTATATDCTSATLSWDALVGASSYSVSGVGTRVRVSGTTVLTESFDGFANLASNSTRADSAPDTYMSTTGWTLVNAYRGDRSSSNDNGEITTAGCFGTGSYAGSMTTPACDLSGNDGDFVVTFKARRWGGDNTASVSVVVNGATNATAAVLSDQMTTYAISCTGGTSETVVQITGTKASYCRFFLDDLKIVSGTTDITTAPVPAENLTVSGTTSYTASGLTPDTSYTFTVTAVAEVGGDEVTTSASVSVSTPEAPARTLILFR